MHEIGVCMRWVYACDGFMHEVGLCMWLVYT